ILGNFFIQKKKGLNRLLSNKLIVINWKINTMVIKKSYEILKTLLKDISSRHTVTSLSKERKISRVGSWKLLKELEKENLVLLTSMGSEKTSVLQVSLKWDNPLLEKTLALLLTEDALKQSKWRYNFKEFENQVGFLILFGSILHSPKEANDIDILNLVSNEGNFVKIGKIITDIQVTQNKKIHAINLTEKELKRELKHNKAYIEALKKGVVLFGQENFIKFIKEISR
ncbi:MAG: hypothetical protein AABX12_01325, partial [Nanoarchaeota archaeon]